MSLKYRSDDNDRCYDDRTANRELNRSGVNRGVIKSSNQNQQDSHFSFFLASEKLAEELCPALYHSTTFNPEEKCKMIAVEALKTVSKIWVFVTFNTSQ